MQILKIPAINGLGKTKGTELAPDKISQKGKKLKLNNSNIEEQEKTIFKKIKQINKKTGTMCAKKPKGIFKMIRKC